MPSLAETVSQFAATFNGQLLLPVDAGYVSARRQGVADVSDAVKIARALGLEVAIRGGGHNVAGRATIDGGLMIDLAAMKGIHVDAKARTVRAQGGVLWKELNRDTQVHGLATTGGVVGSTGIAGLTLGGGLGWLMPKFGLALDNLRAAELVMADGSVRHVSADHERICSGPFAAGAVTSESLYRSSTTCTRLAPSSLEDSSRIRWSEARTHSGCIATPAPARQTS
jgi:FAD/FMN-containing dehydrogenase